MSLEKCEMPECELPRYRPLVKKKESGPYFCGKHRERNNYNMVRENTPLQKCAYCKDFRGWFESNIQKDGNMFRLLHWLGDNEKPLKKVKLFIGLNSDVQISNGKKLKLIKIGKKGMVKTDIRGRWLYVASCLGITPLSLLELAVVYGHMKTSEFYVNDPQEFYSSHIPVIPLKKLKTNFKNLITIGLVKNVPNTVRTYVISKNNMKMLSKYDYDLTSIFLHNTCACIRAHYV